MIAAAGHCDSSGVCAEISGFFLFIYFYTYWPRVGGCVRQRQCDVDKCGQTRAVSCMGDGEGFHTSLYWSLIRSLLN